MGIERLKQFGFVLPNFLFLFMLIWMFFLPCCHGNSNFHVKAEMASFKNNDDGIETM
jgi:hypothetical protein